MMLKRSRDAAEDITAMANCLMLLSGAASSAAGSCASSRVYTCKTCNREFPSFQALGGHRASHKKPRLMAGDHFLQPPSPPKPKTHECSICGLEFPIGQALGGHMRRHRATPADHHNQMAVPPSFLSLSPAPHVQVVKKAANSRRVLSLDLNLTPLENKFVFGKIDVPAAVDCFF